MMHQPFTRERFSGDGGSANWRGPGGERTLRTRNCTDLSEATLSATTPRMFEGAALDAFVRVESEARLTRFGCDCYAYCMLAAGQIDVVIEAGLKPYDIVPLMPIIEGAGGVVTSWTGGSSPPRAARSSRRPTGALHEQVLAPSAGLSYALTPLTRRQPAQASAPSRDTPIPE